MESAIRRSPRIPLTSNILVDADRILSILDKLRTSLPEELRQARYLTQENHRILREAHVKAESLVAEAVREAQRKAEESEIVKIAREEALEMQAQAKLAAHEMREGVEGYAKDVLAGLEMELERLADIVRNGKEKLESTGQAPEELFRQLAI